MFKKQPPLSWRPVFLREWLWLGVLLLPLTAWLSGSGVLLVLDRFWYDRMMALQTRAADDRIMIIAIDDMSLQALGRWPWPRATHATLMARLAQQPTPNSSNISTTPEPPPKAVLLDLLLTEPDPQDARLAASMALLPKVVMPMLREIAPEYGAAYQVLQPSAPIAQVAQLGHAMLRSDPDGVARRVFLREGSATWLEHVSTLMLTETERAKAIARMDANGDTHDADISSPFSAKVSEKSWRKTAAMLIDYVGPNHSYMTVPYMSVLNGEVPASFFADKYVLIGSTATGLGDRLPTPTASTGGTMAGIEIHANILDGLLNQRTISPMSQWMNAAVNVVAVLLGWLGYLLLAPRLALGWTVSLLLALLIGSYAILKIGLVWFSPTAGIAVLMLGYLLWSWRRLEAVLRYIGQELISIKPHNLKTTAENTGGAFWQEPMDVIDKRIGLLHHAIESVRQLQEQRTELVQFLSHDLRTPQASILALLEVQKTPSMALDTQALSDQIEHQVRRTLRLTDDFVQLTQAESDQHYKFEVVDLADLLLDAIDQVLPLSIRKNITLQHNLPELPPLQTNDQEVQEESTTLLMADPSLLVRAIVNLLQNAISYSSTGTEVVASVRAQTASDSDKPSASREKDYVGILELSIRDQGNGIRADDIPFIFDRYRRFVEPSLPRPGFEAENHTQNTSANTTASQNERFLKGLGLGLAQVKAVVDRHGGSITCHSELGKGTEFTLYLPAFLPASGRQSAANKAPNDV